MSNLSFLSARTAYASYMYRGRVYKYDPSKTLDEIRLSVHCNHGEFFKNAQPGEELSAYRGHVVVIYPPLYDDQPKRCSVYTYDPTTGRVVNVANSFDAGGPMPTTFKEFIDGVRKNHTQRENDDGQ